ncbi:MAG: hypothetical protein ACREQY_08710 [Candidatus Binatia bacterium]
MTLALPIDDYESVKAWRESLRRQWGGDPLAEDPSMVQVLGEFCDFVGEEPDAIVGKCFRIRRSDGERVLSVKWRTHYAEKVKEFRARASGAEGRQRGAAVLGFLIHNGILIQV